MHTFWSRRLSELGLLLTAVGLGTHRRLERECIRDNGVRVMANVAARVQDTVEKVLVQAFSAIVKN